MDQVVRAAVEKLSLPSNIAPVVEAELRKLMEQSFGSKDYYRIPVVMPGRRAIERYFPEALKAINNDSLPVESQVFFLIETDAGFHSSQPFSKTEGDIYSLIYRGVADGQRILTQPKLVLRSL